MGPRRHSSITPARVTPPARITWGLSLRLPRWQTFDGRQSLLTPVWAVHDQDEDSEDIRSRTQERQWTSRSPRDPSGV